MTLDGKNDASLRIFDLNSRKNKALKPYPAVLDIITKILYEFVLKGGALLFGIDSVPGELVLFFVK